MTLEEILKRLRKINIFLELSDEMIISYAGESARGYERAVKIGKTCAEQYILMPITGAAQRSVFDGNEEE